MEMERKHCAFVTGATSGIGKAVAFHLANAGYDLFVLGRNQAKLEDLLSDLNQLPINVTGFVTDFTNDEDLERTSAWIREKCKNVHALIHCAGVIKFSPVEQAPLNDYLEQFHVNLKAPFLLTQAFLPILRKNKGDIVFVNSSAGKGAVAGAALYCASKHALKGFADSLRLEENSFGIRILSVFPGRTATPMQKKIFDLEKKVYQPELLLQPEEIAETILNFLEMPRTAEITELEIRPAIKSY